MYIKPQKVNPALLRKLRDMPLAEVESEFRSMKANRPKPGTPEMEEWHYKYQTFKARLR